MMKQYRKILIVAVMLIAILLLEGIGHGLTNQLSTQSLNETWSQEEKFAQISCFFEEEAGIDETKIMPLRQNIVTAMQEASIDTDIKNGRSWVDAYSAEGELTLMSEQSSMTARAYGVSEDFFLFHPMKLLSGNYFGIEDGNHDGVILDENVAWQLFGSSNVTGLNVEINGIAYVVRGVIKNDKGLFSEKVGEDIPSVYVAFDVLEAHTAGEDATLGIDNYELLISNPVKGFGTTTLTNALALEEDSYEMVENSSRYHLSSRLLALKNNFYSTMKQKTISYPYWENRAKGYEQILQLFLILEIICCVYPVICVLQCLYLVWKKKDVFGNWVKARGGDLYEVIRTHKRKERAR